MMWLPLIAGGWLCGLWLGLGLAQGPLALPALLGFGAVIVVGLAGQQAQVRRLRARYPLVTVLLAIGAGWACGLEVPTPPAPIEGGLFRLKVLVLATERGTDGSFLSRVRILHGQAVGPQAPLPPGALLRLAPHPLQAGTTVLALARVRGPLRFRNPSPHPPWPDLHPLVGFGTLVGPASAAQVVAKRGFWALLGAARARLRFALHGSLPPRTAALACALLLGDRRGLDPALREAVSAAGLAHVLAVSGLHVGLMAGLWARFCRACCLRCPALANRVDAERVAAALSIPMALWLGLFCGGAPSALRAALTAAFGWSVRMLGCRPFAPATTAAATLCLTAIEPRLALEPAFLLSLLATIAVLRVNAHMSTDPLDPTPTALASALRVGIATTVATAPITVWCFGQLPLLGPLVNLVGVPLMAWLVLPAALMHGLASLFCPPLQPLTGPVLHWGASAFSAVTTTAQQLAPGWTWPCPTPTQGVILSGVTALLAWTRKPRRVLLVLGLGALLWLGAELHLRHQERVQGRMRIHFLDVGQGDSAWIDLPNGQLMLIDGGGDPIGQRDPGQRVLLPQLAARRRQHVDVLVLSHPHPDHYGGLAALLGHIPVRELWDSGQAAAEQDITATSHHAFALLRSFKRLGTHIAAPATLCQAPRRFGAAEVRVLNPCPTHDSAYHENNNSLVLLLRYGQVEILFTGDAEAHTEQKLLAQGLLQPVDVLKVGHHGSRTSSTTPFLQAVRPQLAVISRGSINRFGHPHRETLQRLAQVGTRVVDIGLQGGTTLTTDGRALHISTWSGEQLQLRAQP